MAKIEFEVRESNSIREAIPEIRQEVKKELYAFANEVMAVSKERVPVLTGALMNTGKVLEPVEEGDEISVQLGYGDESAGYALFVHENLNAVNWTRPGSGPKYLEQPLMERIDDLPARIASAIKRVVEKI